MAVSNLHTNTDTCTSKGGWSGAAVGSRLSHQMYRPILHIAVSKDPSLPPQEVKAETEGEKKQITWSCTAKTSKERLRLQ